MSSDKTSDNPIFMTTLERFHDLRVLVQELATQVSLELEHQAGRLDDLEDDFKLLVKEYADIRRENEVLFAEMKIEDIQRDTYIESLLRDIKVLISEYNTNQGIKKFVTKWWYPIIMMIAGALVTIGINAWIL